MFLSSVKEAEGNQLIYEGYCLKVNLHTPNTSFLLSHVRMDIFGVCLNLKHACQKQIKLFL